MNTGQLLLVIGALTLLSIVSMSVNSLIISKTTTILQAEASLAATSIAQSMLDEILTAQFDSATVINKVFPGQESKFTTIARLGPEVGITTNEPRNEVNLVPQPEPPDTSISYRSAIYYNDIDDYHNYRRYYYSQSLGLFTVKVTVIYVTESNPDIQSGSQTFLKKVNVYVRHRNLAVDDRNYDEWASPYYLQLSDIAIYRRYL
ncbi:MAG: hypothetical protein HZB59_03550 [Ignavibacteriales bacterium]|nr:hypothetical protein [Ignavibacteriales bacterium]